MSLPVLLVLVVGGIAAIAVLLQLVGMSALRVFDGKADAAERWLREFPSDDVVGVTMTYAGTTALIETRQGPGLVWAHGADTAARRLDHYDVSETKTGLRIDFHDFAAPHVHIRLEAEERAHWLNMLSHP